MNSKIKYFLLVSSEYDDPGNKKMDGASNSGELIYNLIKNDICLEENILYSKNEPFSTVKKLFEKFLNQLNSEDIFVFHFIGHGNHQKNNNLVLCLKDTFVDDNSKSDVLKYNYIKEKLNENKTVSKILILDCCASGIVKNNLPENSIVLCANTSSLLSIQSKIDDKDYSILSYEIYNVLKNKQCSNISEMFTFIENSENLKNLKITPNLYGYDYIKKLPLRKEENDILKDYETVIDWRITDVCTNNCGYCYALTKNTPYENEITDEFENRCFEFIDKIDNISSRLGEKIVCISGGEPTTLGGLLPKVVNELHKKNFIIFLSTNGAFYLEHRVDIENNIAKLSLPLDGYDENSNVICGRSNGYFNKVKEILDIYKQEGKSANFKIKISTVLTKKNCNVEHFEKLFNFINNYSDIIDMWKIYQFIPEARGKENKNKYLIYELELIQGCIKDLSKKSKYKIVLMDRQKRNSIYFIIQPNGDVIIPTDNGSEVNEKKLGNILDDPIDKIIYLWQKQVNRDNQHYNNENRCINKSILLTGSQKKLLDIILSKEYLSLKEIQNEVKKFFPEKNDDDIKQDLNYLYGTCVIRNTIPMVNLKKLNLTSFLFTVEIPNNIRRPKFNIENILKNNKDVGWVVELTNGNYRIAIFAKNYSEAKEKFDDIKNYLGFDFETDYNYNVAPSFSESAIMKIDTEISNIDIFDENRNKKMEEEMPTKEDFDFLLKLKNLERAYSEDICLKLNDDKAITKIKDLKKKGLITGLYNRNDKILLGYKWYIIFVRNSVNSNRNALKLTQLKKDFKDYVKKNIQIIHLNENDDELSTGILFDFEVQFTSSSYKDELIRKLETKFTTLSFISYEIIREINYNFLTSSVIDALNQEQKNLVGRRKKISRKKKK